ncbi:MAG: exonuclease [Bacteroidetes bacterium]|nr:MAG: exonuclease [Bacteroidota bacterium]
MYSIIDIETTGGNPYRDKITEIAIFVHDGRKVVKEFHSLINPERKIPYFISRMTGITDEMVARAPKFYEIAKSIVEVTENTIFVAHNASFDYNFLKTEFKNLGYFYQRESLCTVKLSRKIIPGKKSYSLGKLCQELDIQIEDRHRAKGDAMATVKLFELLVQQNPTGVFSETLDMKFNNNPVNPVITKQMIEQLPSKTGIYYLMDEEGKVLYIGKSKDIKKRVLTHLSGARTKRALEMVQKVGGIEFEITGSELLALLRESEEIKHHQPFYNRSQKRCLFNYGLFSYKDENGYLCLKVDKTNNGAVSHTSFASLDKGKEFLFNLTEKFNLCQNLTGLYATKSACFQYAIKQCKGACVGEEGPESYNTRSQEAIEFAGFMKDNLIVLDHGRTASETSFIMIENGKYMGYGYAQNDHPLANADDFKILLSPAEDNRDTRQIISGFLRNKRTGKRIVF